MFEKEVILREQLAVPYLFQCSPARKLLAKGNNVREKVVFFDSQ
jgi:hypothetical protein